MVASRADRLVCGNPNINSGLAAQNLIFCKVFNVTKAIDKPNIIFFKVLNRHPVTWPLLSRAFIERPL